MTVYSHQLSTVKRILKVQKNDSYDCRSKAIRKVGRSYCKWKELSQKCERTYVGKSAVVTDFVNEKIQTVKGHENSLMDAHLLVNFIASCILIIRAVLYASLKKFYYIVNFKQANWTTREREGGIKEGGRDQCVRRRHCLKTSIPKHDLRIK